MNMINNYLSNLESYLTDELKTEVRDELEASILAQVDDQQQELGRELNGEEIEAILRRIGHPMRVAAAYLPDQQLVSSELFPAYKRSLEITLAVALGLVFLVSIPSIFTSNNLIGSGLSIIAELIDTALYVFAIVTIVFFLMQKYDADLSEIYAWSPNELKGKSSKLSLSRLEIGFESIFFVLFMAWWNGFFNWPADVLHNGINSTLSMSLEWQSVFWSVNVIMGLSVAINLHKFALASWNKFSLIVDIALNLAAIFIAYQIFQFEQFVIFDEIIETNSDWPTVVNVIDRSIHSVLAFVVVISAWDIFKNLRKFIRN